MNKQYKSSRIKNIKNHKITHTKKNDSVPLKGYVAS